MDDASPSPRYRWQAFWERCRDPVFLLDRHSRLAYANPAWASLTGHAIADALGLTCTRRKRRGGPRKLLPLARALAPPADVWDGHAREVVRPVPGAERGPPWWQLRFEPFADEAGLQGVFGRLHLLETATAPRPRPLGEAAATMRHAVQGRDPWSRIEPRTPAVTRLLMQAAALATIRAPVCLIGEAGTGKSSLARRIHRLGPRALSPFVKLDCAALPADALEPILFGPLGFGGSDGGGLLLANVERLPAAFHDDLFDILELGDGPRVLVSSRQPLAESGLTAALAHRLEIFRLELPSLRLQRDDLSAIAEWLTRDETPGKHLAPDALECLLDYPWPGNFTELRSVIRQAAHRAKSDRIEQGDLPLPVRLAAGREVLPPPGDLALPLLDATLDRIERRLIELAMQQANGVQSRAAELLGIYRPRLLKKLKGIDEAGPP